MNIRSKVDFVILLHDNVRTNLTKYVKIHLEMLKWKVPLEMPAHYVD